MYQSATMMMMVCESPLHAGTGSDLDFIDKPIQRERHTGYPKIESSSLKGAIRERFRTASATDDMKFAFGPESNSGEETQGALGFTDARLLLFPVKSMKGVFAWITCPGVLKRFEADMQRLSQQSKFKIEGLDVDLGNKAMVFTNALVINPKSTPEYIVLEEYAYQVADPHNGITINGQLPSKWLADMLFPTTEHDEKHDYWNKQLQYNLVILSDTDFADFTELTTEVITRNQIDATKGTVKDGHLFTEEYLPTDSVLYSLVMAHPEFRKEGKPAADVLKFFTDGLKDKFHNTLQVGGNATIGKGLIRTVLLEDVTTSDTKVSNHK